MEPSFSDSGITWRKELDSGEAAEISFIDIRRERTGVHAMVGIILGGQLLEHDTFNITRVEERRRLVKASFAKMGQVQGIAWPLLQMESDLSNASLLTPVKWEEERLQTVEFDGEEDPGPVVFLIKPYIVAGGGSIFFAPPGTGKSYILQSMAVCLATGTNGLWAVPDAMPVLYISLERDIRSLHRRENALKRAHGLPRRIPVSYLDARGVPLPSLTRHVKAWLRKVGRAAIFLDSISRTGGGPLNEDETANRLIDTLNGLGAECWAAIGHTPEANKDKLFGSTFFKAGADVEIKMVAEQRDRLIGVALSIVKANDIGHFPPEYIALEFEENDTPVRAIRHAREGEFPALLDGKRDTLKELISYLRDVGSATGSQIAEDLDIPRTAIVPYFTSRKDIFKLARKEGRNTFYTLKNPGLPQE